LYGWAKERQENGVSTSLFLFEYKQGHSTFAVKSGAKTVARDPAGLRSTRLAVLNFFEISRTASAGA
jgi:hypothetical protein